ncbi:MAG TPA: hypothetical protein PLP14_05085, partial [Chitinophagaceae bacterium]|nr:hypothetical protein [Chitinophagaceae bacterium]
MASYHIEEIQSALKEKKFPTSVLWNRLEGRPRTHHFNRALKAEVRDAMWMLCKQWQLGELDADDAGSPVSAKIQISSTQIDQYRAAQQAVQNYNAHIPLEVQAEQKKIPFNRAGQKISIDLRLQMGNYWMQLLKSKGLTYAKEYILLYGFQLPENNRQHADVYAHPEVWSRLAAVSGRSMDGYSLLEKLMSGQLASESVTNTDPDKSALDALGTYFLNWYRKQFVQPLDEENNAWQSDRLEYRFDCSATAEKTEKKLKAEEYHGGHLDWYSFDLDVKSTQIAAEALDVYTDSFIPSHVQFDGMPDTRWWKFEDQKTSFGDIKPSTTDLSKLLLMEFGLIFANDWFIVPFRLPVGSLANINGLTVRNNFGEQFWIEATEQQGGPAGIWSMYKLKALQQDNTLFLAPTALKVHEGDALEEVVFIRDEMANMVWGIEKLVPSLHGQGMPGAESDLEVKNFLQAIVNKNPVQESVPFAAPAYYQAMTEVPGHWIPFLPVHIEGDNREIQLQRASMLRILEGDTLAPAKIKPSNSLLREGLDDASPKAYFIHEEEIPRAGIRIS